LTVHFNPHHSSLEVLCNVLVEVFDTPDRRSLLMPEVRRLIPNRMQAAFNDMMRVRMQQRERESEVAASAVAGTNDEPLGRRRNWTLNPKRGYAHCICPHLAHFSLWPSTAVH
jgi:SRSO17 transposase